MDTQWRIIYKKLQEELGQKTCEVWIDPLISCIENTTLSLSAPNSFTADWIRTRYTKNIEEAMQATELKQLKITVQPLKQTTPHLAKNLLAQGSALQDSKQHDYARVTPLLGTATHIPIPLAETSLGQSYTAWRHDFDSFIVGQSNELAHAAARAMTQSSRPVDTLFLSSSSGLGKTHLTQSVGKALCDVCNHKQPKVAYLTAETFAAKYVQAMQTRTIEQFKNRFRDVDILLLEDIQFLQNKPKMQEELLGTIKTLQENNSRVVLTSSFAPKELQNIDEQLVSRFASGFLANIEKPDKGMRTRILMQKALKLETPIPLEVADALAERLQGDVRQLESSVHTLILRARLLDCPITIDLATQLLAQYCPNAYALTIDAIIQQVAEGFKLTVPQMTSRSRKQEHVIARNTIFYLARQHTDLSLEDLGLRFNRRHSTVIKGIDTIERALRKQSALGRQVEHFLSRMQNKH